MQTIMDEIEKIENNWNTSSVEKENELYNLGKKEVKNSQIQKKCFEDAISFYLESNDDICFCNLAHCYFLLARLFNVNTHEYYRKSIEYHIKGSKKKKYQHEDFYKFYVVDESNISSILKNIRLTKPSEFNDPTDCPIAQDGINESLFPEKNVFDGLRVCSFGCIKGNNKAWEDGGKWAYYGGGNKGICIRYRFFNNVIEKKLTDKFVFGEVKYKEKFDFYRGIVADGFLSKCFSNENEWRIICYDRNNKDKYIHLPIRKDNIYQIFLGYRCSDSIKETVLEFAKSGSNIIPVMKIHPDINNVFKLTSTRIN